MIDYATALQLTHAQVHAPAAEHVALADALGRVAGADLTSAENLPPFDNSAMDGFALATLGHRLPAGSECAVRGESAAGDGMRASEAGIACEIMTGAPMPRGLDAIVPVEQTETLQRDADGRARRIRLLADVVPGQHLRRAGEDVACGSVILTAGSPIDPERLMLLAALGIDRVPVMPRPRAAVICTGRELLDAPGSALADGQIRNSNGPYLAARLQAAGAEVVLRATVGDAVEPFLATLQQALAAGARVVVSTGAVSMGRYDFVPAALGQLGAEVLFHKVAIRPGKPILFAVLPGGALFFGLPGNPVSSAVGLRFFVQPALRALLGLSAETPLRLPLAAAVGKKAGFRLFQKARAELSDDGRLQLRLLTGQESFRIRPLAEANVWAVLPEAAEALAAGELVDVHGLDPHLFRLITQENR